MLTLYLLASSLLASSLLASSLLASSLLASSSSLAVLWLGDPDLNQTHISRLDRELPKYPMS